MQTATNPTPKVALNKYGYNTIARHISLAIMISAPLFLAAQTFDWPAAWIYSIVNLIGWIALSVIVAIENPGLMNVRGKRTKDMTGTKPWDWIILTIYFVLLLVTPTVAGLDYRNGWSGPSSPLINWIGIGALALGFVPLTWAMAVNKFFEGSVRIQADWGQTVTASGPYRYVRHPGYVGVLLHFIAVPLSLGTWVALIPALLGITLFVARTALEDRALQQELPGYADFATRTRYRLFPGLW